MVKKLLVTISLFIATVFVAPVSVGAQVCTKTCSGDAKPQLDYQCQRAKIFNPDTAYAKDCSICLCPGDSQAPSTGYKSLIDVNVFGTGIRVNSPESIGQLLYLLFSMFLGIVALAAVILGVYAGFNWSRAETDDDIAKAKKVMVNAIIGFVLVVIGFLFAQLLASFLGVGSLDQLVQVEFSNFFK